MADIIISGYYGFSNSGDDALLLAICKSLKELKPDVKITVLSANPEQTMEKYGVNAINRMNIFKIRKALKTAKLFISGGGSLIQDSTSIKSLVYYLSMIKMAKRKKVPVMIYAAGIGPLIREKSMKMTKKAINDIPLITLRDSASFDELSKIGVTKPVIKVTADPVFTLLPPDESEIELPEKYAIISIREWKNNPEKFCEHVANTADWLSENGISPIFLPMHKNVDTEISQKICGMMKSKGMVLEKEIQPEQMMSVVKNATLVVGMRLHTLVYAAVSAVPSVAIVYDPKVCGFMNDIGNEYQIEVEKINEKNLCELVGKVAENLNTEREKLEVKRTELANKAAETARFAIELMERKDHKE